MRLTSYLVNLLLQDLFGDLQVLQADPQLLILLLQMTPLLFHVVQLTVETDGHVLRHLGGQRRREGWNLAPWVFRSSSINVRECHAEHFKYST